jgi:DNA uptake protein ComE-like DNA-binding protein
MKRHHLIPTLAALTLAFALPALAATTTAQNATASKSGTTAKSTSATKSSSSSAKKSTTHHNASASHKTHKIDVNTATREELMTLAGVTGDMADKIIAGRPYKNMSELESKNIVTKAEYNKIKSHITTKAPATHAEAPASQGNSGATQNASSSDQTTTPTDQTTK